MRRIRDTETLEIDARVTAFAKSLFDKVPRSSASNVGEKRRMENRAKEREALQSQSKRYAMVDSDDDDDHSLKIQPKKAKKAKKEKRKKESESDEDEFVKVGSFKGERLA